MKLSFQKTDWLAIALVVLLSVITILAYLPGDTPDSQVLEIWHDGALLARLPLETNTVYPIAGAYHNTVTVENGRAYISETDCPGGDCMHSDAISAPGRSIVCLPNRVELRITGSADVDFVVGGAG